MLRETKTLQRQMSSSALKTIWRASLNAEEALAYDDFVKSAKGGHYTQTRAWALLEGAARPTSSRFFLAWRAERLVGAAHVLRPKVSAVASPTASVVRGPVCENPYDLPEVLTAIHRHLLRTGILKLSVMPYWSDVDVPQIESDLASVGFSRSRDLSGPHIRSLRLDVRSLPSGDLFAGPDMAKVRREIRRAERLGARVRPGAWSDLNAIRVMHQARIARERHRLPAPGYYKALLDYFLCPQRGALFVTEYQGQVVAAVLIARHGDLATFVFGESSEDHASFPKMIQPLAAAITWAQTEGVRVFDLGGIPREDDADPKRNSIAEFKRTFSRSEIKLVSMHFRWL